MNAGKLVRRGMLHLHHANPACSLNACRETVYFYHKFKDDNITPQLYFEYFIHPLVEHIHENIP